MTNPHEAPIPQDLQNLYEMARTDSEPYAPSMITGLIKRIAVAEKRAADAKEQVKALGRPISREEIERSYRGGGWIGFANRFNSILAARMSSAGGNDGK